MPQPYYHIVKRIQVDSADADYLAIDPVHRLLWGAGREVINIDDDQLVGSMPIAVDAAAIAPDIDRGMTRSGLLVSLETPKVLRRLPVGAEDGVVYDPVTHRAFLFGGRTTVVDLESGTVVGNFALHGTPQSASADGRGRVFVNLRGLSAIGVFDARSLQQLAQWSVKPCTGPTGLAADSAHRRLFASCINHLVAVVDMDTGNLVTTIPVGGVADANAFDPATQLILNPDSAGTLTLIHEDAPDKYSVLSTETMAEGRNSIAIDEKTHRIFTYARTPSGLRIIVLAPAQPGLVSRADRGPRIVATERGRPQ